MIRFLLNRVTTLFIVALVLGMGGVAVIQYFYVIPKKSCLKAGNEWIEPGKDVPRGFASKCATVIDVRNMPILPTVEASPAASAPKKS
jgi:hypothetical protein